MAEAFANAVKHPQEPTSHLVEFKGTVMNGTVAVSVLRLRPVAGRVCGQGRTRGLGLAIMDELMDSVVVEPFADGTTVTMQRRLAMN